MNEVESLFDRIAQQGWGSTDSLLKSEDLISWRKLALEKLEAGLFKPARIASGARPQIRSDSIFWLDNESPEFFALFRQLNEWKEMFCREFTVSAPKIEAHFAHYGPGKNYERHCDQARGTKSRLFTFVVYLNESWKPEFGGELRIFKDESTQVAEDIAPQPGRVVFFKSDEIWHQVQESHFNRLSLTGWFRHS